jgi:hypothetical protein
MPQLPFPSRQAQKRLAGLAERLERVFNALDDLPREGAAPPELRGEVVRVFEQLSPYFQPEEIAGLRAPLRASEHPQMLDLFVSILHGIEAFKYLDKNMNSARKTTYARAARQW